MKILLFIVVAFPTILFAQSRKERKALEAQRKADQVVINNLKTHIQSLTNNESPANTEEYISTQFKLIGLKPKNPNGFIQAYSVDDGKKIAPSTYLKTNDKVLEVNKDYFPLPYSAEKKVTGTPAMALRERGVPWFVDLKDLLDTDSKTPKNNVEEIIRKEAVRAASKGATALLVYNSGKGSDTLAFNSKDKSSSATIPVIYVTQEGYKKYFNDHSEVLSLDLNVAFREGKINGNNVIGYINNSAPTTMVIGTHYNTPNNTPNLVNSTNNKESAAANTISKNNSSGVAMMIELAKLLSLSKAKSNNYVFIAFEGPAKNSAAEQFWLNNSEISGPINYMINLDLDGYNDSKKILVQGVNSSLLWKDVLNTVADKKVEVTIDSVTAIADPYAIFTQKGIPQLLFTCADASNPSETADKQASVNYVGELQIARLISRIIEAIDMKGKIAFAQVP